MTNIIGSRGSLCNATPLLSHGRKPKSGAVHKAHRQPARQMITPKDHNTTKLSSARPQPFTPVFARSALPHPSIGHLTKPLLKNRKVGSNSKVPDLSGALLRHWLIGVIRAKLRARGITSGFRNPDHSSTKFAPLQPQICCAFCTLQALSPSSLKLQFRTFRRLLPPLQALTWCLV